MTRHEAIKRLRGVMRRKHLSLSTEESYAGWLVRYTGYVAALKADYSSEQKIEKFLTSLAQQGVSASTQNQAFRPDPRNRYATDAERQTARRIRRYAAGLNSQGKPYQRHPHFVNHGETPTVQFAQTDAARAHKLKNDLARYHRNAQANRAAGLRVDGQPFRRHQKFHAWKNFRSTLAAAPLHVEDFHNEGTKEIYA